MADTQEQAQEQKQGQQANGDESSRNGRGQDESKNEGASGENKDGEEKKKPVDPRRKRTIRFVLLAVLVVAIIASVPIFVYYSVRESTDDAQVDGHIIGISARISGYVQEVLVNDNQQVSVGQSLVRLDPSDYQVAFDQAQAQLAGIAATTAESQVNVPLTNINTRSAVSTATTQEQQATAAVNMAIQGTNTARARLNSSNASLAQAQANFIRSQKDLARTKALVEKDEISKQEYDSATASADGNAAQVEAARAEVVAAQHTLDQAIAQVDQAKASLASAVVQRRQNEESKPRQIAITKARYEASQAQSKQQQAAVNQAKLNLDYTLIKAPISGIIGRKTAEPGIQVAAGQQMMALIPLDDIWVTANFKETQLKKMRLRQAVEIEVDTYGSARRYLGHIDSFSPASGAMFDLLPPQNATGNFVKVVQRVPVKIVLEPGQNRDHSLRPGMSVVPTVLLNRTVDQEQRSSR